jgi:hypothetical protein
MLIVMRVHEVGGEVLPKAALAGERDHHRPAAGAAALKAGIGRAPAA